MTEKMSILESAIFAFALFGFVAVTYSLDKRGKMPERDGEQDAIAGVGLSNIVISIIATIGAGLAAWLTWYLVMPS
jgi:hypothetical protein